MSKVVIVAFVVAVLIAVVGLGVFAIKSITGKSVMTSKTISLPTMQNINQTPAAMTPPSTPANQIKLVVLTPTDKAVVASANTKVAGQTVPNADVSVNEVDTKADASGNFSATLSLNEGDNPIIVDAFDADGNTSEQELTVTYQIPGQ